MNKERLVLSRVSSLPEPRHLFSIPTWADSGTLGRLMDHGYLTCVHCQRNSSGDVQVAMGLQLTTKGERLIHPPATLPGLVIKGSLAGASFTAMSLVILYLG